MPQFSILAYSMTDNQPAVTATGAWIKLKLHLEQEFVIGGYTDPEGGRKCFGSLLVGFYEGKNLKFAGRVGTGFSEQWMMTKSKNSPKPDAEWLIAHVQICGLVPALRRSKNIWRLG